jgi:hypothetical protein
VTTEELDLTGIVGYPQKQPVRKPPVCLLIPLGGADPSGGHSYVEQHRDVPETAYLGEVI